MSTRRRLFVLIGLVLLGAGVLLVFSRMREEGSGDAGGGTQSAPVQPRSEGPAAPASPEPAPASATPPADALPDPDETGPGSVFLLVRDSVTKEPIAGARVYFSYGKGGCRGTPMPLPACIEGIAPCLTDAGGRCAFRWTGGKERTRNIHIVAAGHRWGHFVSVEDGGTFELEPGSAVRLTIGRWVELEEPVVFAEPGEVGEGPDPGAVIHDPPSTHALSVPAGKSGSTVDEGIAAGTWTYFVRRGLPDGEIYARGDVSVVAGEVAEFHLDAVPTTAGLRVPVKVVASIPEPWMKGWYDLEIGQDTFIPDPEPLFVLTGLDPRNRHLSARSPEIWGGPDSDGLWRATLDPPLPEGRYRATVSPSGWVTEVEVRGQSPEVRIDLPEPGSMRVFIEDATTGERVSEGWVRWAPEWRRLDKGRFDVAPTEVATGSVVLRSRAGNEPAFVGATGYLDTRRELSFVAGSAGEVHVSLNRSPVLVVRLSADGKRFEGAATIEVILKQDLSKLEEPPDDSSMAGIMVRSSGTATGGEFRSNRLWAGSHEIRVSGISGFEDVPPRGVELRFGVTTEVEFDLVRSKGE